MQGLDNNIMKNRTFRKNYEKLCKYKTKNEMVPTFVGGIFLSSAINILTNDSSRNNVIHMVSMSIMFFSSILFFFIAAKTHELQTWFSSIPVENKTNENFLNGTTIWDYKKKKDFFKPILLFTPYFAWILGIASIILYLSGQNLWYHLCYIFENIVSLMRK